MLPALLAALLFAGGLTLLVRTSPQVTQDTLEGRVVVSYEPVQSGSGEDLVSYEYVGAPLPEKLVEDEVVEKRTENSYTRYLGTENEGTANERRKYQATFFEKPIYVKQGGAWHYREEATTTESAFYQGYRRGALAQYFIPQARAASYSGFSTSGDGYYVVQLNGDPDALASVDFGNCVFALDASFAPVTPGFDSAGVTAEVRSQYRSNILGTCQISRGYLTFDTSSVPPGSTISAATLQIYVTAKTNQLNDGNDTIQVTRPNATWTSWTGTGSNALDIGSISTSAYNTFTLNATGYTYLTLGGTSELGLQGGHDLAGSMADDGAQGNSITYSTSEQSGTTQDPTLSITYTAVSKAFWLFQDY